MSNWDRYVCTYAKVSLCRYRHWRCFSMVMWTATGQPMWTIVDSHFNARAHSGLYGGGYSVSRVYISVSVGVDIGDSCKGKYVSIWLHSDIDGDWVKYLRMKTQVIVYVKVYGKSTSRDWRLVVSWLDTMAVTWLRICRMPLAGTLTAHRYNASD